MSCLFKNSMQTKTLEQEEEEPRTPSQSTFKEGKDSESGDEKSF